MIFISVGTTNFPFKRADFLVNKIIKIYSKEKIVYQNSQMCIKIPKKVNCKKYLNNKEILRYLKVAEVVIIHAGFATTMEAIRYSKVKPVLIPRLKKFGEHVNDHQLYFAKYMEKKGLVKIFNEKSIKNLYLKKNPKDEKNLKIYLKSLEDKKTDLISFIRTCTS